MIDKRFHLTEAEYYEEYFLKGRPVLLRNAVSLADRCSLAASRPDIRADIALHSSRLCGATAYPELTGRHACGRFNFLELRENPRCEDKRRTRPVCNWKLGSSKAGRAKTPGGSSNAGTDLINTVPGFRSLPSWLRHENSHPPLKMMRRAWDASTSRALWGGTAWSGSGFHYHNAAYNALLFGKKEWMLTPPRYAGISDLDSVDWPDERSQAHLPAGLPLRFTQHAGDIVIVPAQWGHSTMSVGGFTLGLGVLWCDRRWRNVSAGECHFRGSSW
jgi:hypothetical protein